MRAKSLLLTSLAVAGLAGCGSDGIDLNVSTTDNSVDNSTSTGGNGSDNPCASYVDPTTNSTVQGSFDGTNCVYSANFVSTSKPLTVDLTIPFISGVHIFQDSLFVGTNVSSGAAPAAGTGPTLTIEAGNKLAFIDAADYLLINRGSSIVAAGSPSAPITFSGYTDLVTQSAGAEDVQLWGGIVINGNGITNNCTDAERSANQCHVVSEGQPSNYGGNDNTESSGTLQYVVVKHTGFEVAPGDELNGITFNAVGSGTTVDHVEVYSTYDDGVEFFGGAVNVANLVALYVRDDSIDYSDGYVGTISNALVIHSETNGNRCIEADNIGETRASTQSLNTTPISNPSITNLTCITSNMDSGTHGDSEGLLFRFGARVQLADSIVFGGYGASASNECFEIESTEGLAAAQAGDTTVKSTIITCQEATKGSLANGDTLTDWVTDEATYANNTDNFIITDATSANVSVLAANSFYTATSFTDASGTGFTVTPVGDASIGAVTAGDDWTANWTYGLHAANRGQPLWFE